MRALVLSSGGLVPTFRSSCYASARTFRELRKVTGTSKSMIIVPLFYLKFLDRIRRLRCRNFKKAALDTRTFFGWLSKARKTTSEDIL